MHNTIPGHWNRVAYYSQHWFELIRKLGVPISRGDEETLPWKAQERRDADPCLQPRVRVCASVWCESGWGGRGAVSLAAVSVLMERERERGGLQDPVCQQPACERHCRAEVHHWQMSKSPPSTPPFTPPFPSWSIFLFCLWAQRTQRPFKTATGKHIWSCCRQGRRSSSMLIYFTSTTVILLVWIWHVVL